MGFTGPRRTLPESTRASPWHNGQGTPARAIQSMKLLLQQNSQFTLSYEQVRRTHLAQWSRYTRACDPINETLTRPHEPTFSNGIFWLRIVLLQFVSKYLSQMISDPQVYFHPILAARCRQAHNLLPDWSELTLLGSETPVHPRWHLDPGSG